MEFATGALGTLLPKLGQLLHDKYKLHKSAKKNIEFLSRELESSQVALRKVGNMPPEQLDEQVSTWAREVRELSYDMEDIVDTFLVRIKDPDERPSKRSVERFVKDMRDFVADFKFRHDIGQEIMDIKERVKEVAERRDRYKVHGITPAKTVVDPRIAFMYTKAADLVGLDDSMQELIKRLTKGDGTSVQQQRIASVVGIGGLGKTTLAKAVYDKLKGQFNCSAFVSIGQNPSFQKVFRDILINLDEQHGKDFNLGIFDERELRNKLGGYLENKRYIIVIDDVWEVDSLNIIKLALNGNNGCRIIVTTRNYEVARKADDVYELQQLSEANSRKLFFGRISGGESKSADDQQDDEVSDKILNKCGGIPLAIITMASVLLDKPREDWSDVHRSIGSVHNEGNTQVENTTKILSFSYYELPLNLRACLLYLSVFPEDHFIEKTRLIWMWIAEGFVHEEEGISSFEVGEGYFNKLVNRCMIQPAEDSLGDEDMACGCQVHDMVLDLIRSISSKENFVTSLLNGNKGTGQAGKVRRLALQSDRTLEATDDMKQARAFISHGCDIGNWGVLLSSFKFIRVLAIHTSGQRIECQHLKPIKNLLHLRCLELSGRYVDLPEKELATLKFLHTLDVAAEGGSEQVAASVGLLTKLRCLRVRKPVIRIPDGIGKLTSLEELEIYNVLMGRRDEQGPWRPFIKELGNLTELRVLRIRMGPSMKEQQQDMVHSLLNLHKLKHLSLSVYWQPMKANTETWEEAQGSSLLLPRHLRELFLPEIIFSQFPSFFLNASRLPSLSHLSVRVDYLDVYWDLRILGRLPELHYLELRVQSTVELVRTGATEDAGLFRKLRCCKLFWYGGIRLLSSLDHLDDIAISTTRLDGSMLLGPGRNKDVAPTLLPSIQELWLWMRAQDFKAGNPSFGLEFFASVKNVTVEIDCDGAYAAKVKHVEAALRRAAHVHPNCPTLEVEWRGPAGTQIRWSLNSRVQTKQSNRCSVAVVGSSNWCSSLGFEFFASVKNVTVEIDCDGAYAAKVKYMEAALQRAAHVHPNCPTLEVEWRGPAGTQIRWSLNARVQTKQSNRCSVTVVGSSNWCSSFGLEFFASVKNVTVEIDCDGAYAAKVKYMEAALQHAAHVHPNCPTLEVEWRDQATGGQKMISAAHGQKVLQERKSDGV
ncbi:unnamed protein product [Urochloa decumbens]|uniref:Uncharacterized protein n=1 Tax=Urochloa decumbens TaxID=240449 RepID=A0ABC9ATI9_9POAL